MINETKFNQIVSEAKAKAANDPKWLRAIERAAREILSGEMIVTLFADNTALVTTANGQYRVNGVCKCKAAQNGHTQCAHRAGKRLMAAYEETAPAVSPSDAEIAADVAATPRKQMIVEIKAAWPATWPPLGVELMARFKVNQLDMLDIDMLRAIRLTIAA